jgi:hypothetical protein
VLYLIKEGLLSSPILYLSRYVIRNKPSYYELLQRVRIVGGHTGWKFLDGFRFKDYTHSMITRLTGKNQVTVPAEIARKEGMRAGTRLDWRLTDRPHVLEVRVLPDPATLAAELRGRGKARRRMAGSAVKRLIEERRVEEGLE